MKADKDIVIEDHKTAFLAVGLAIYHLQQLAAHRDSDYISDPVLETAEMLVLPEAEGTLLIMQAVLMDSIDKFMGEGADTKTGYSM